jgi:hypothetical protein
LGNWIGIRDGLSDLIRDVGFLSLELKKGIEDLRLRMRRAESSALRNLYCGLLQTRLSLNQVLQQRHNKRDEKVS